MSDLTNSGAVLRRITFRSNPKELAVSVLRKSDRSVKVPNYLQNFLTGLSQRQALASAHDEPGTLLLCSKGTKIALFVSKCQHISVARRHKHQQCTGAAPAHHSRGWAKPGGSSAGPRPDHCDRCHIHHPEGSPHFACQMSRLFSAFQLHAEAHWAETRALLVI